MVRDEVPPVPRSRGCRALFGASLLVSGAAEVALLWGLHRQLLAQEWALTLHGLIVLGLVLAMRWQRCADWSLPAPLMLVVSTALFGPLAAPGMVLLLSLHRAFRRQAHSFQEWYDSLFPAEELSGAEALYRQLERQHEGSGTTESFMDLLDAGSRAQKRAVIVLITRHFRPAFAPALLKALADGDNTIRVLAATALARIEQAFTERAMALDRAVAVDPDNAERRLERGRHYDDYAFTGLLQPDREQGNRTRALADYEACLAHYPDHALVHSAKGRLLLRGGEIADAADYLGGLVERGITDPRLVIWYLEALFRLGDYPRLREVAGRHGPAVLEQLPPMSEVADAVRLWTEEAALHAGPEAA
jgi:tetratricopeptide (TPR) repeat protein